MNTIRICTLVRNRAWILPYYLDKLMQLNYNKKLITIHWIVNNSSDSSLSILQDFKQKYNSKYNKIIIEEINKSKLSKDERSQKVRVDSIYKHLAEMRNYLFNKCKEDYLFNIDSDILVEKETLNQLLDCNKDMVASVIYNGYEYSKEYWNYTNLCIFKTGNKTLKNGIKLQQKSCVSLNRRDLRVLSRDGESIIELDVTGAICLYSKKLYKDKKVRFGFDINGEDYYYCKKAKQNGYKIYGAINSYAQHIMSKKWLDKYGQNQKIS